MYVGIIIHDKIVTDFICVYKTKNDTQVEDISLEPCIKENWHRVTVLWWKASLTNESFFQFLPFFAIDAVYLVASTSNPMTIGSRCGS